MNLLRHQTLPFYSVIVIMLALTAGAYFQQLYWQQQYMKKNEHRNCDISQALYRDSSKPIADRIKDLLSRMTVEEKIGQMALVEKNKLLSPHDIIDYNLGALLSGGGSKPAINEPKQWRLLVDSYQTLATQTCLQIPLFYGVDANHGHANVPGATVFPHFIGLGATHDPVLVQRVAQATAEEMLATGIEWNFSPDLDVARDYRWGRVYETFGSDTDNVALLGRAFIEGTQMTTAGSRRALATAKHYVGSGEMLWGSSVNKKYKIDQGRSAITEAELRAVHLPPFKAAVESGVLSIMAGLNNWDGQKLTAQRYLLTDVLKKELGFQGFVVSDWYGVYEVNPNKYLATVMSINAGTDMVMLPYDYQIFTADMLQAIARGDISQARLDDAVSRILRAKFTAGLFDPEDHKADFSVIGSDSHRALAREAVRKSLVLLKNDSATLPLSKDTSHIVVAGSAADNIGQQSGAWTIEWQGVDGNWIAGTSILAGMRQVVSNKTQVEYNEDGNFAISKDLADVGIAVVGEKPYAEGYGDSEHPSLSPQDLEVIARVKAASKKIIVLIISGRPLDIKPYVSQWDGVVAAWLPGSAGEGIADVLFGDYSFSGTLPVRWDLQ